MPELPSLTAKQVVSAFEKVGFVVERKKGSHQILKKRGYKYHLSIPDHGRRPLKQGLLRRLIRDSGISVGDFLELL